MRCKPFSALRFLSCGLLSPVDYAAYNPPHSHPYRAPTNTTSILTGEKRSALERRFSKVVERFRDIETARRRTRFEE
jgi:hypothetical protein